MLPHQERYAKLFTAVVRIDQNLNITYVSALIGRYAPEIRCGDKFDEVFELVRPQRVDVSNFHLKLKMIFLMLTRESRYPIRGQMIQDDDDGFILYGSPWLSRMTEDQIHRYEINDFPLHDAQLDWLFMLSAEQQQVKDLKRLSTDLEQAKAEAESAIESKSAFFAVMSHEMRTPLNAIIGAINLMSRDTMDAGQLQLVDISVNAAQQLLSVINDVLDYSKMEAGKLEMEYSQFELVNVFNGVISIANPHAREKKLELILQQSSILQQLVRGDNGKIKQILLNLVTNAIKFTSAGTVTLSARELCRDGEFATIRLAVSDTGIGITPEDQKKLFEQFWTSSISQGFHGRGTGLGLNIVKRMTTLMNGKVGCDSQKGKGSTFWVELPLEIKSIPAQDKLKTGTNPDVAKEYLKGKRVLVAEDNQANQVIAKLSLQKLGMTVDIACNGLEALRALQNAPYDVVLMDIGMPEMGGIEATEKIRQELGLVDLPIIACTAHSMSSQLSHEVGASFDAYVGKPIDKDDLIKTLLELISPGNFAAENLGVQASTSSGVSADLIDKAELTKLRSDIGEENMSAAIEAMIAELHTRSTTIQAALSDRNLKDLGAEAHALKSSALSFGALKLAEALRNLEQQARAEDANALELVESVLLLAENTSKAYSSL